MSPRDSCNLGDYSTTLLKVGFLSYRSDSCKVTVELEGSVSFRNGEQFIGEGGWNSAVLFCKDKFSKNEQ